MTTMIPAIEAVRTHSEVIGHVAAALTTTAFMPQLIRTWRTGGRELSWTMLALFGSGVGLWLVYGVLLTSAPVIAANALTGVQVVIIAVLKKLALRTAPRGCA
jgi:MtN3 and saliva related transmembrane protein